MTWTAAPPRWRLAPVPCPPRWIGDTPAERVASIVADDRRWAAALRWTRRNRALYVAAEQIRAGLLRVEVASGLAEAYQVVKCKIEGCEDPALPDSDFCEDCEGSDEALLGEDLAAKVQMSWMASR